MDVPDPSLAGPFLDLTDDEKVFGGVGGFHVFAFRADDNTQDEFAYAVEDVVVELFEMDGVPVLGRGVPPENLVAPLLALKVVPRSTEVPFQILATLTERVILLRTEQTISAHTHSWVVTETEESIRTVSLVGIKRLVETITGLYRRHNQ